MYEGCTVLGSLLFVVVTLACFLYVFVPSVAGLGNEALASAFADDDSREKAKDLIRLNGLILGICSLLAAVLSVLPITATHVLVSRIKTSRTKTVYPQQLRVALKVAQCISLVGAVVMLCYEGCDE